MQYPALYRATSEISRQCQQWYFGLRATEFTALVLAAVVAELPSDAAGGAAPVLSRQTSR